jgi:predicted  nucleic acid-binding Zn-ribbon protein
MRKLLVVVVIVLFAGLLVGVISCSNRNKARQNVVKKGIGDRVDESIGKEAVDLEEVKLETKEIEEGKELLRQEKFSCQIEAKQVKENITQLKEAEKKIKSSIGKIQPYIADCKDRTMVIKINGEEFTADRLQRSAKNQMNDLKNIKEQIVSAEELYSQLMETSNTLAEQQVAITTELGKMESQIETIKHRQKINDIHQRISGVDTAGIFDKIKRQTDRVNALDASTKARQEAQRERYLEVTQGQDTILIEALESPDETAAEISALLGADPAPGSE